MKNLKFIAMTTLTAALALVLAACNAKEQKSENGAGAKPYPLDACLVCGMNLGKMSKPFVFIYQGQEIKVCEKSEKAEFDKDPAKYMKNLANAEVNAKK